MTRNSPHERCGDGDASGSRDKIVKRQSDHLREVRHGGLTAVALPIGVRRETRRGVERAIRTDAGKLLRIEGKKILQPQNRVGEQAADQTEQQHCEGVLLPVVLFIRIDTHDAISPAL